MVKIRLMRLGSKKNPQYRVVVIDARKKLSGNYIESLGYYDPRGKVETPLKLNVDRAQHWLLHGAQPTGTALRLLEKAGVSVGNVIIKRSKAYQARA